MNAQFQSNLINFSLIDLSINFLIGVLLSSLIYFHYNNSAKKRILRKDMALVLPILALTTLLVITLVKSSLALSLGLVGALSIVRFRTPIKEPEELAYIFLSIALGLCLGADQREAAICGILIILSVFSIYTFLSLEKKNKASNLILTFNTPSDKGNNNLLGDVTNHLSKYSTEVNFRRIDSHSNQFSFTCIIKFDEINDIQSFLQECRAEFPESQITLLDDFTFPNE